MSTLSHLPGFQNCKEVPEPVDLSVQGTIPDWLHGTLYRNGPGTFDIETREGRPFSFDHWFDGLTTTHKFQIGQKGGVTYRNRHMAAGVERRIAEDGRTNFITFGNDTGLSAFGKLSSFFRATNTDPMTGEAAHNVGVTLGRFQGDRFVSKTDANILLEFDPETLKQKSVFNYSDVNPAFAGETSAAHSQYDIQRGEYFNFTLKLAGPSPRYNIFCVPDKEPKGYLLTSLKARPAYIHSFALTENYFILIVWPSFVTPLKVPFHKNVSAALNWDPRDGTHFYVIDRSRRECVATYRSEAFYCFHNVNAYEEDRSICIDLCAYDDADIIDQLRLPNLRSSNGVADFGRLRRYYLRDVGSGRPETVRPAAFEALTEASCELPRFNQTLHMRKHRYVYGVSSGRKEGLFARLAKVDTQKRSAIFWEQPNAYPGEAIFVAAPNAKNEDDGVLLSVVMDGDAQNSFLVVLDAKNMREIARATVPQAVPFGFHGNFYGSHSIQEQ